MSSRKKNRGFWGSVWDMITAPFVLLFEILIAMLEAVT